MGIWEKEEVSIQPFTWLQRAGIEARIIPSVAWGFSSPLEETGLERRIGNSCLPQVFQAKLEIETF